MRICELKEKEVINVCSGKRLGCIADVEINICTGEIEAIVIPGPGKICGFFGTDCEYVIPFSCIKKIGPDIVLVEIKEEKFLQKFYSVWYNNCAYRKWKEKGGNAHEMSILWKSGYESD